MKLLKHIRAIIVTLVVVLIAMRSVPFFREEVECPFCHAGNVDSLGRCERGDRCGNYQTFLQWDEWPEEERSRYTGNPGHYRENRCAWCGISGKMTRWDIMLD